MKKLTGYISVATALCLAVGMLLIGGCRDTTDEMVELCGCRGINTVELISNQRGRIVHDNNKFIIVLENFRRYTPCELAAEFQEDGKAILVSGGVKVHCRGEDPVAPPLDVLVMVAL